MAQDKLLDVKALPTPQHETLLTYDDQQWIAAKEDVRRNALGNMTMLDARKRNARYVEEIKRLEAQKLIVVAAKREQANYLLSLSYEGRDHE